MEFRDGISTAGLLFYNVLREPGSVFSQLYMVIFSKFIHESKLLLQHQPWRYSSHQEMLMGKEENSKEQEQDTS